MNKYMVCPDALIHFARSNWIFSNPKTKMHVALGKDALKAIEKLADGAVEAEWVAELQYAEGRDLTDEFFGQAGLVANHTGINRKSDESTKVGQGLFDILVERWLLITDDKEAYRNYFQPLTSILDRGHQGTFHERVGQYLAIKERLRADDWQWWHGQKFEEQGVALKSGAYKSIQEYHFDTYFSKQDLTGLSVLDFGCGNGYYSAKLSELGAKVLGVDLSEELINIAKQNHAGKAEFVCFENPENSLSFLQKHQNSFDMIFMQDVLLLLINPKGSVDLNVSELLKTLRQTLKPHGRLYTMEPNATFWLAGIYGDSQAPYAIVTEYRNQTFGVAPTLPQVMSAMHGAGFALIDYAHPESDEKLHDNTFRAFANQFCVWDFMCFVRTDV